MRRVLTWLLTAFLLSAMTLPAQAEKKGKGKGKGRAKSSQAAVPTSDRIAEDLGELKWGQSLEAVTKHFTDQVEAKYRKLTASAHSAIKVDQLRAKKENELAKIRDSIVKFDGAKTGWDVSFLQGEFTHNNGEALLVIKDDNSQNFFFFIQNRLWKWYKAFESRVFRGSDFAKFATAVEKRYGEGAERKAEVTPGAGERQFLEWQNGPTRLRAIDQTSFYGFYCLVFDDKATLGKLAELRRHKTRERKGTHSLVEKVTAQDSSGSDAHQDVADRITGRIRHKEQAPPRSGARADKAQAAAPEEPVGVSAADDPLRGL